VDPIAPHTAKFTELVQRADADIPLGEAMLLVAAHDHAVDIDVQLGRLDALATGMPDDPIALARTLFVERGFLGNDHDYTDPRNSFLDVVLDRRLGIPITLSILMLEIGKRVGASLSGIGMPGHFLVGTGTGTFLDPFHGGAVLDRDGARELFGAMRGDAAFSAEYLAPVGNRPILARVLANLVHAYVERDLPSAAWAARLRLRVPGLVPAERREVAALLGSLGHYAEAAAALESIASELDDAGAARVEREAAALRARTN
jgi:regulator of sirC expression with transglutaminase-like and TPR domain